MTQIVDGQLTFEAIDCQTEWRWQNASVINQQINFFVFGLNELSEFLHRLEVAGIQILVVDINAF